MTGHTFERDPIPFAFVVHPDGKKDIARKYPIAQYLPERLLEKAMRLKSPQVLSEITGFVRPDGKEVHGWLLSAPRLTSQLLHDAPGESLDLLLKVDVLAHSLGAKVGGLGAYTAICCQNGKLFNDNSQIPWSTANSNTVAMAVEATLKAMRLVCPDRDYKTDGHLVVVGATGSIGKTVLRILASEFGHTTALVRDHSVIHDLKKQLGCDSVTTNYSCLEDADVVVTATSHGSAVIKSKHLKGGSIVIDVARPRDVSAECKDRRDILVIEGGVVKFPGNMSLNFDTGYGNNAGYACFVETAILGAMAIEEAFTLGKDVSVEQVQTMRQWSELLGFKLAKFRMFNRFLDPVHLQTVRDHAEIRRERNAHWIRHLSHQ